MIRPFDSKHTIHSVLLLLLLFFFDHNNDVVIAKEIIATNEWQKVGPTDTLPAGLEIRMDLSGGGNWARLPQPEIDPPQIAEQKHHDERCGPSCKQRQQERRAGLRGSHRRREQVVSSSYNYDSDRGATTSWSDAMTLLMILVFGVGVASCFRRSWRKGLHES
jgi:hypothetical protein